MCSSINHRSKILEDTFKLTCERTAFCIRNIGSQTTEASGIGYSCGPSLSLTIADEAEVILS